jgi:hypothetical protein
MIKTEPYKYKLRPAYKSKELLIEFFSGVENDAFELDINLALSEIEPEMIKAEDLWMNDEVLNVYNSKIGSYTLSKDNWNNAFIISEENQNGIIAIEQLLMKNPKFEKIEVDFDEYA